MVQSNLGVQTDRHCQVSGSVEILTTILVMFPYISISTSFTLIYDFLKSCSTSVHRSPFSSVSVNIKEGALNHQSMSSPHRKQWQNKHALDRALAPWKVILLWKGAGYEGGVKNIGWYFVNYSMDLNTCIIYCVCPSIK